MIHIIETPHSSKRRTWSANTWAEVMDIAREDADRKGVSIWYTITGQEILDDIDPDPDTDWFKLVEKYGTDTVYFWDWENETFTPEPIDEWDATRSWMAHDLIDLEVEGDEA